MKHPWIYGMVVVLAVAAAGGCTTAQRGSAGAPEIYAYPATEPEWIRNGEPIQFEGKNWYPVRSVETLLDSEVYLIGEYRGTQVFVEKTDIRPFMRLYTKFDRNRFRFYEQSHDQN